MRVRSPITRASLVATGLLAALLASDACSTGPSSGATGTIMPQTHSGPIALSRDGAWLYVVHPDADTVTVLATADGTIARTLLLAPAAPALDENGDFTPSVMPRALTLDPAGGTLYVTGERSGHVYAFDAATGAKVADVPVCAEPIGVVVDAAGTGVFVACSQDDLVVELSADGLRRVASTSVPHKPWALAWASDGRTLLSTHLLGWGDAAAAHPSSDGNSSPGVTALTTSPLAVKSTWTVVDGPPGELPTIPHGQVRGVYDAAIRPGTQELWTVHLMLGTDTSQPTLDFQSTVFPAVSILDGSGAATGRLSVSSSPGDGYAFADVVSGPRALTFSPDGHYAFVVDTASEDILVVDAQLRVEAALVRPLPGHQPEGVVWGLGGKLYVQERNTEDIAVIDFSDGPAGVAAVVEPSAFASVTRDPMPGRLRLGQHLFASANSDEYPMTSNHWVSCASCHLEGRSDAVTWKFAQGPRDTPSNAGGVLATGFLFRTADRNSVTDYWKTIDVEQGGDFSATAPSQQPLLDALTAYVNHAVPLPVPPTADAATESLRRRGEAVFASAHCDACHSGPAFTDSGALNPSLDLGGPVVQVASSGAVLLHDVGTCTKAPYADVAHQTIDGLPREACLFDTPTLRGLSDSAPYLHDGSAATIEDAVRSMLSGARRDPSGRSVPAQISPGDMQALVAYLEGL